MSPIKVPSKDSFGTLVKNIRSIILTARQTAVRQIDFLQVVTSFEIGRQIVEYEQQGADRAKYGAKVLVNLSQKLSDEFGNGFSSTNLKLMRQFFLQYRIRIGQTLSDQLPPGTKGQTLPDQSRKTQPARPRISLSWSHYVFLLGIKNSEERNFYEIEATQENWSLRELKRQFNSGLYERLALSRNKTMQMYVNYFDRFVKRQDENPTVGIILCRKKHDALVEITLPKKANIHAAEYQLYLPSKEVLKRKLLDWTKDEEVEVRRQ